LTFDLLLTSQADPNSLAEKDVLEGDIYGMIAPYGTANLWWWPYLRKFHLRYYDPIPAGTSDQEGFQSTFSVTKAEADIALGLLNSGTYALALHNANTYSEQVKYFRRPTWLLRHCSSHSGHRQILETSELTKLFRAGLYMAGITMC
jgi:hypothetical protein